PEGFAAFVLRRQHVHPDHRLVGPPGLLTALEPLQGEDFPVKLWEQELLPARLEGYEPAWLDQLGLSGDLVWTPFERRAGRGGGAPGPTALSAGRRAAHRRRALERVRRGGPGDGGAARRGVGAPAARALRRRGPGAGARRLEPAPPRAPADGVRRRGAPGLLR